MYLQGLSWALTLGTLLFVSTTKVNKKNIIAVNLLPLKNSLLSRFPPHDSKDSWVQLNRERLVRAITKLLDVKNKRRILDVGCAEGGFVTQVILQMKKQNEVIGIDISRKSLTAGIGKTKLKYVVADATHLPFRSDVFDLVIAKDLLHHVESPNHVINESLRVNSETAPTVIVEANRENFMMRLFQKHGRHQHLSLQQILSLLRKRQVKISHCTIEANPYYPFFDPVGHALESAVLILWDVLWLIILVLFRYIHPLVKIALSLEDVLERIQGSGASFNILIVTKK